MFVPSGIQSDEKQGVAVRTLSNGAVVVDNAYQGSYHLPGGGAPLEIRRVSIDRAADRTNPTL
jgi:hypothetical protein